MERVSKSLPLIPFGTRTRSEHQKYTSVPTEPLNIDKGQHNEETMTVSNGTKKASVVAKSIKKLEEDDPRRANKTSELRALSDESYELGKELQDAIGYHQDISLTPDDILIKLGGCGLFQFLLAFLIQFMKIVVCWGMGGNAFFAYVPKWRCLDYYDVTRNDTTNGVLVHFNTSASSSYSGQDNRTEDYWNKKCDTMSGAKCTNFEFDDSIHTLVSEFDLVCDKSWVTASIISMQMIGMMVGSIVVGNISDLFGRKKPFVLSMLILCVFHLVCYFSVNWVMFAIGRIGVGVGSAFFLSIYCIFQGEYTLSKWRSTTISFPSWAIELSLFTLCAWLLHDWEHITLIIALGSFAFLGSWFFLPESFRWLIAKDRVSDIHDITKQIAKWNKRPVPNNDQIIKAFTVPEEEHSKKYSILVLFRQRALLRLTVPLMTGWFALGVIGYGIGFGIKKLSGNLFLNLFLFSVVSIPSKVITIFLQNRIGRKYTTILSFALCLLGGTVVGVIQYIDTPFQGGLTNGFAFAASAGVDGAWGPMQTLTVEVYPTLARNTGFGFLSTLARLGAVVGPQLVYLEDFAPGLLYFIISGYKALSNLSLYIMFSFTGRLCSRTTLFHHFRLQGIV
ncbi:solute carrier family 22 member 4-like isoform X2 [Ruditapes philippinarum]|uniref:solute carrier family 22 member 4-like isoform X2 n=1 Tax=Ruditapes philippinarum TaxID=129788 RepID=UPI00295BB719|nr:solute carrier family 22 member 4-like isoform X2 [Ruditapes philippinarum]